jgi:NADH-quinone oxidoreductase subunit L
VSTGTAWTELGIGGLLAIAGIALAYFIYLRRRELRLELRERFDGLHTFLLNKWYFDELFDLLFTRPVAALGRFGRNVVETEFVQGTIVGGATGAVRAGSSFARAIQTGYLRGYALLLLFGVGALALYFLIASS